MSARASRVSERTLVRRAWLARSVTAQVSPGGGNDVGLMDQAAARPPRWFRDVELGLGMGQGPSIYHTEATLPKKRKAAAAAPKLEAKAAEKKKRERTAADERQREWRARCILRELQRRGRQRAA